MENQPIVYGSNWCGYTVMALQYLDEWGVSYQYVDVDEDAAAERLIASWNNGRSIRPTIQIGEDVWVNPSPRVLRDELEQRGLLPQGSK